MLMPAILAILAACLFLHAGRLIERRRWQLRTRFELPTRHRPL